MYDVLQFKRSLRKWFALSAHFYLFLIQAHYTVHLGTLKVEIGAVLVVYFHNILNVFLWRLVSDCEQ